MIKPSYNILKRFDDAATLERIIKELKSYRVRIGFLAGAGVHDAESMLPTATIAVYNEYGTPTARHPIPARPFMRPVFRDKMAQRKEIKRLLPGTVFVKDGSRLHKSPRVNLFFNLYGMAMASAVQKMIRSNSPPENAEYTKLLKESSKTLIDTGAMVQAVSYEVVQ